MASLKARLAEARRDDFPTRRERRATNATKRRESSTWPSRASRHGAAMRKRWRRPPFRTKPTRPNCAIGSRNPRRAGTSPRPSGRKDPRSRSAQGRSGVRDERGRSLRRRGGGRVRSAREAAWSGHRVVLDCASAAVFEAAMRRDDSVGATRLPARSELAALRSARCQTCRRRSGTGAREARPRSGGNGDRRA